MKLQSLFLSCLLVCLVPIGCASNQGDSKSNPQYVIEVTQGGKALGNITLELFPHIAPKHVANFDSLVSIKFYDGVAFHRIISGFMIQGGDPNSKGGPPETWGMGEPGQRTIPAEFSNLSHDRGCVSAARRGGDINSATSQFFICHGSPKQLDNQYTIFGKVVDGMDVVDKIAQAPKGQSDRPLVKIEMKTVTKKKS